MAPARRSKSFSQHGDFTDAEFTKALKGFSQQLKTAKKKDNGQMEMGKDILDAVNGALIAHDTSRGDMSSSQSRIVHDVISELDDDICGRLSVPVVNTLLQLFLQTLDCDNLERGLYLLAASLHRDTSSLSSPLSEQEIQLLKAQIGKESVRSLLIFFTNSKRPVELRRWAGILLRQLFHDSEENITALSIEAKTIKQGLGGMLSTGAKNDCLVIICGQVIKEVVDQDLGFLLKDLWPDNSEEELCHKFPSSSQAGRWNQLFQAYIEESGCQEWDTQLFYAQAVYTKPTSDLERPGHTSNIIKDFDTITIWSPASKGSFDHFLDIPIEDILEMTTFTSEASQLGSGETRINIGFKEGEDRFRFLNGTAVVISEVNMIMLTADAIKFQGELSDACEDLIVKEVTGNSQEESRVDGRQFDSQASISEADEIVILGEGNRALASVIPTSKSAAVKSSQIVEIADNMDHSGDISESARSLVDQSSHQDVALRNATLNSSGTNQTCGATKSRLSKAKVPSSSSQGKIKGDRGNESDISGHDVRSSYIGKSKKTNNDNVGEALNHSLEDKVADLSQAFPSERSEVIRGVLLCSNGDMDWASNQLLNQGKPDDDAEDGREPGSRIVEIEVRAKEHEHFESTSFTSLDDNDASTPKLTKPLKTNFVAASTNKSSRNIGAKSQQTHPRLPQAQAISQPKYRLKPKQPLKVSNLATSAAKAPRDQKPTGSSQKASKSNLAKNVERGQNPKIATQQKQAGDSNDSERDPYDIDMTDAEDDPETVSQASKGKKAGTKSVKAPITKASATTKSGMVTRPNPKKRQSAPAALPATATATRPKRGAAKHANRKIHSACLSGSEVDEAENVFEANGAEESSRERNEGSQNKSQQRSKANSNFPNANRVPSLLEGTLETQRPDAMDQSAANADSQAQEKKISKRSDESLLSQVSNVPPPEVTGVKKQSQHRRRFFSHLGHVLDDGLFPEREEPSLDTPGNFDNLLPIQENAIPDDNAYQNKIISTSSATIENGSKDHVIKIRETADNAPLNIDEVQEVAEFASEENKFRDNPILNVIFDSNQAKRDLRATNEPVDGGQTGLVPNDETLIIPDKSEKKEKRKVANELKSMTKRRRAHIESALDEDDDTNQVAEHHKNESKQSLQTLIDLPPETALVNENLARKPQVVIFGVEGALNQGPSSILAGSSAPRDRGTVSKAVDGPTKTKLKRTKEDMQLDNRGSCEQIPGRPKKRQNTDHENGNGDLQTNDDGGIRLLSSPALQHQHRKGSQPSSQVSYVSSQRSSRVEANGSPLPPASIQNVDHFGKLEQKLSQSQERFEDVVREKALQPKKMFAPKPSLISIPKANPLSPQEEGARLVKHKKLGNGRYEGVERKDVVIPENPRMDPFIGRRPRASSGFTERLQASAAKENREPETVHQLKNHQPEEHKAFAISAVFQTTSRTVKHAVNSFQIRSDQSPQKTNHASVYEEQTTLVNSDSDSPASPEDLTSESSVEEEDEENTPMTEKSDNWQSMVRPHYAKLSTVVDGLHKEIFVQLAKEEDLLGLLVAQYRDNGQKLIDGMTEQRAQQKVIIVSNLDKQKEEMLTVYREAKTFVNGCEQILKSSMLPKFEKQWRREQEDVQRLIDEGRKTCQQGV